MCEPKPGRLVGTDYSGNRYYENNREQQGRNRWVDYAQVSCRNLRPVSLYSFTLVFLDRGSPSREMEVRMRGVYERLMSLPRRRTVRLQRIPSPARMARVAQPRPSRSSSSRPDCATIRTGMEGRTSRELDRHTYARSSIVQSMENSSLTCFRTGAAFKTYSTTAPKVFAWQPKVAERH